MLEDFIREMNEYYSNHKVEMVNIVPSETPAFNPSLVIASICNIPKMSDSQLREFIHCSFDTIMNLDQKNTLMCFTDIRFLDALSDVISRRLSSGRYFDISTIVKINNICYDYITIQEKDNSIANRLYAISNLINSGRIPVLLGLGISSKIANLLYIARYSSTNPDVYTKRIDFIIIQNNKEFNTVEKIERTLITLYDLDKDQKNFIILFSSIMSDVLGEYSEDDPMTHWITSDIEEADSMLSLAILNILNDFTSDARLEVIRNYAQGYSILGGNKPVRFSMRSLSDDYANVIATVNYLTMDGIYVP